MFILDLMEIVSKLSELLYVLFDGFAALSPWERILMHALWTMQSVKLRGKLSFFCYNFFVGLNELRF
jgi:hypothetical protein